MVEDGARGHFLRNFAQCFPGVSGFPALWPSFSLRAVFSYL
ncbi:hypothetical protein HMPREF1861_01536 [Corynebacterium kroppenstedtii]|nr:hypothetical protein HMPREF1861_01536 [Corynebacterium kroppenstedtii]